MKNTRFPNLKFHVLISFVKLKIKMLFSPHRIPETQINFSFVLAIETAAFVILLF